MWQWLNANKEIISMFANIATVIAVIFAARALYLNAKTTRLQKETSQANLFHKITKEINTITAEQKKCEKRGEEAILNWYQRLINLFEYYAFFVNRGYFTEEMETYYRSAVIEYCDWAKGYSAAENFFKSSKGSQLDEIRKYYEKYSGSQFPI